MNLHNLHLHWIMDGLRYSDDVRCCCSGCQAIIRPVVTDDGSRYKTGFRADCAFDAIQNIFPQVIL